MLATRFGTRLAAFSFALALGAAAAAQNCPGPGTFWKRDNLPQVPGLSIFAVVPGVCEGESAGVVFEMPANMAPQKLTQVTAPWGEGNAGVAGFQAQLDVEVYDGVSFTGGIPNMGTQVFSLGALGQGMNVATNGLNSLDVSSYDIVVGLAPATGTPPVRRFAICFRVDLNLGPGTCAAGYTSNFFTDTTALGGPCTTPQRTALIEMQGQGWRDASLAQFTGLPLAICPIAYNGTWAIRACSVDAFPASFTTIAAGCPGTIGVSHLIPATPPRIGTSMLVIVNNMTLNLGIMLMGFTNFAPPIDMGFLGMPTCPLHTSFEFTYSLAGGGGQAVHTLALPLDNSLLGLTLYDQALSLDPINSFGAVLSDAGRLVIGL